MGDIIAMQGICKHYTLPTGIAVPILKSVELFIEPGEFVAIMGPSGSGKSTLMNILGTLDRSSSGIYMLDGEDIRDYDDAMLARIRNRTIGFVFQGFNLLPGRTIVDNIALPLFYGGESRGECIRRAEYYLEQIGLSTHRNYYPPQLSGGQQQRVAIARALAGEPKLLLADEPTGNLDSQTSKEIMEIFSRLNRDGITVVLVTHSFEIAACAPRLLQLKDGEMVYDGPMY
jgi:putative ABC transport system ATP-binding protein